jgi:hypothetical protein
MRRGPATAEPPAGHGRDYDNSHLLALCDYAQRLIAHRLGVCPDIWQD